MTDSLSSFIIHIFSFPCLWTLKILCPCFRRLIGDHPQLAPNNETHPLLRPSACVSRKLPSQLYFLQYSASCPQVRCAFITTQHLSTISPIFQLVWTAHIYVNILATTEKRYCHLFTTTYTTPAITHIFRCFRVAALYTISYYLRAQEKNTSSKPSVGPVPSATYIHCYKYGSATPTPSGHSTGY